MEHAKFSRAGAVSMSGPGGKALFLALTFILVVIVALLCSDAVVALLIIGLLLGLAAALLGGGASTGGGHRPSQGKGQSEGFAPKPHRAPVSPPPYALAVGGRLDPPASRHLYPGAIDLDEYDSEAELGHRDQTEGDNEGAPFGNPFNPGRISHAPAASACIDDEANDAEMDGDESAVYQGVQRNDAARVTAGIMNRRRDLDRHLREEVTQEEDRRWWGRHEL